MSQAASVMARTAFPTAAQVQSDSTVFRNVGAGWTFGSQSQVRGHSGGWERRKEGKPARLVVAAVSCGQGTCCALTW